MVFDWDFFYESEEDDFYSDIELVTDKDEADLPDDYDYPF